MNQRIENFNLNRKMHLGDLIVFINAIYSLALQEDFYAEVACKNWRTVKELLEIFDYEGRIKLVPRKKGLQHRLYFTTIFSDMCVGYWCPRTMGYMSFKPVKIINYKLPNHKLGNVQKKNYQCYQLNCFSCGPHKRSLRFNEIKKIIQKFDDGNSYYIGKPNTRLIIPNIKTHFANLKDQALFLLGAKSFFGIDSGMSHLAGVLKIPSDVVIQRIWRKDMVKKWYNFMYPTSNMHYREILG